MTLSDFLSRYARRSPAKQTDGMSIRTMARAIAKAGRKISRWFRNEPTDLAPIPSSFAMSTPPLDAQQLPFIAQDAPPASSMMISALVSYTTHLERPPTGIYALPFEILGEIFKEYLAPPQHPILSKEATSGPSYRISSHPSNLSSSSPAILSQVCKKWEQYCETTPTLWCKVSVNRPGPVDVEIFQRWLGNSRDLPLDLTLTKDYGCSENVVDALHEIFHLALMHSRRWKRITLELDTDMGDVLGSQPLTELLVSFDIRLSRWSQPSIDSLLRLLYSSPNLCDVTYDIPCPDKCLASLSLMPSHLYSNITRLHVWALFGQDLFPVLAQFLSLQHLSLSTMPCFIDRQSLPDQPLCLPNLQCLTLAHGEDHIPILQNLCLPSLKRLELPYGFTSRGVYSPGMAPKRGWDALLGLVERSWLPDGDTMKLESLVVGWIRYSDDERALKQTLTSPLLESLESVILRVGGSYDIVDDPVMVSLPLQQLRSHRWLLPL